MKIFTQSTDSSSNSINKFLAICCFLLMSSMSFGQTTLLNETFGTTNSVLPTGWTSSNATNGWNGSTASVSSTYTGFSASANVLFAGTGTSGLTHTLIYNNTLSTVGYTGITVLWGGRGTATFTGTVPFEWSSDGTTWNAVTYTQVSYNGNWALVNSGTRIALPAGAAGISNLRFRWTGTSTNSGNFRIDDFTVQGTASGTTRTSNAVTGSWTSAGSWVGGNVPVAGDNVVIVSGANITFDAAATRNSGTTTTVNSGGTLTLAASYTNSGATTINGTVQVNGGGYASGTAFEYAATGSALIMNHNSGLYGISTGQVFWPTALPPFNVTIQGTGAQINNTVGTVAGTLSVNSQLACNVANAVTVATTGTAILAAQLNNIVSGSFISNGILKINGGGYVSGNSPTYGASSNLTYNTTSYTTSDVEFPSTGVKNVTITAPSGNNTVTLNSDKTITGALIVGTHSLVGAKNISAATITVGTGSIVAGNLTASTSLVCSGASNITVSGNWAVTSFTKSTSTVTFNGTGSYNNATLFYNLTNSTGTRSITQNIDVENTLAITGGQIGVTGGTLRTLTMSGATSIINIAGGAIYGTDAGTNNDLGLIISGAQTTFTGNATGSNDDDKKFFNVTVNPSKTLILQRGILCKYGTFTVNGTLQINVNGYIQNNSVYGTNAKSPIYGSAALLKYNVGGYFGRGAEWTAGSGTIGTTAGYPNDIQLSNTTTLDVPFTANFGANAFSTPLALAKDLTIDSGSALYMDYGGNANKSGSLTVGKNVIINGTLTLGNANGGDMNVGGNWNNSGSFNPNGRAVQFNSVSAQTLTGATTFDYLTLGGNGGVTLQASSAVTVNNTLTLGSGVTTGKLTLGANTLTIGASGAINGSGSSSFIVANVATSLLKRNTVGNTATLFPIGLNTTNFTPITLTNTTGTSDLSVSVVSAITNAVSDTSKIVNLQWNVASSAATTATITPVWVAGNQAASFTNSGSGELGNYTTAYTVYPVSLATTTTTATGVALRNGSNSIVIGNTGAVYSPPPANDICSAAIVIPNTSFPVSTTAISNALATTTNDPQPSCQTSNYNKGIWYSFTPATTGSYSFSTCPNAATGAAILDNILYIATGTCGGTFTTVACNDDATNTVCSGAANNAVISNASLTAGVTYYVIAYTYASTGGVIQIKVDLLPPPTITSFASSGCAGSSLVITGTNLSGATAVTIGGTAATITANTSTSVTVTVGSGTTGAISLTASTGTVTSATNFTINPLPTAVWASTATAVCFNSGSQTTTLAYTSTTNSPTTYGITWNSSPTNSFVTVPDTTTFAGTPTGGTINITVPAGASANTYTGNITVKANGCTSTNTSFTITVNPIPTTTWASAATPVCFNANTQITPLAYTATTNSPNLYSITWNSIPANSFGVINNASFAGTAGGGTINIDVPAGTTANTYSGTITTKSTNGCISSSSSFNVVVNANPGATASNNGPLCEGDTLTLTAEPDNQSIYAWSGPNAYQNIITQTVTQNFNSLGTGNVTWTDNSTLPGWYLLQGNGTGTTTSPVTAVASLTADSGSGTTGAVYNYSNGTATSDRALGSIPANSVASPGSTAYFYGVKITNTTGTIVNSATITYSGEEYRNNGANAAQSLTVDYSTNATALTTVSGTWNSIPALTFTSPVFSASAAIVDGNTAGKTANITTTINGLSIASGSSIWIRWSDLNDAGNDHGLAIDDVSVTLSANNGQNPTVTTNVSSSSAGIYNLTVTSSNGCTSTANTTVIVRPRPTASSISGGTSICLGTNTNLSIEITGGTSPYDVVYSGGSLTDYTSGSNISVSPNTTTAYTITSVTDDNGCVGIGNTGSAVVNLTTTTTTDGGANWDFGTPNSTTSIIYDGGTGTIAANMSGCSLKLTNNAAVLVSSNVDVSLSGPITVDTGSTFTLNNNANLLQGGASNTNSGNIKVNRDSSLLYRFDYTLWSSPVALQKLFAFSPLTSITPTVRFYTYNSLTDAYSTITSLSTGVASTDTFETGTGYLIRMPFNWPTFVNSSTPGTSWTGTFEGKPNNGDIPVTISTLGNGFTAVGNPYPSAVSIPAFLSDNSSIDSALWFWRKTNQADGSAYVTYINNTYSNGPQAVHNLEPGQGFFVKYKTSPANLPTSIIFKNTQRVGTDGVFFKDSNVTNDTIVSRVWLNLISQNTIVGSMAFGYKDGATNGLDTEFDGKYINDSQLALNSIIDNTELSVQHRAAPFNASDVVPLSFKTDVAGTYNIAVNAVDGIFTGGSQAIYLKDNLTTVLHNLNAGAYTFASDAGVFNSRFEIVYADALGVDNPVFSANDVVIYSQNNGFVVNSGNITMSSIKVFDIRGRLIEEKKAINANQTTINGGLTNEVLLVQITSEDGAVITKKVVK